MNLEQLKQLYAQYFYYILFADIVIGLLLGAVPLILGIRRKKHTLGFIGFIAAGALGALSPILSLIVAAVFTFLIVRKSTSNKPADSDEHV